MATYDFELSEVTLNPEWAMSARRRSKSWLFATCAVLAVTACGGGGSGGAGIPPPAQNFVVMAASSATGGSISPSSATVKSGDMVSFSVAPSDGYSIGSVTGCGGVLSGNTYTTGAIQIDCTVSAIFAALGPIWKGGSDTRQQPGSYGTRGQPAATNVPSARSDSVVWTDVAGNLWLFGGFGSDSAGGGGYLNDLWKYTSMTGEWTWVGGSNTANAAGAYGVLGQAAAANVPGARDGAAGWIDSTGNLWLFGGTGHDASAVGVLGDLWEYTPSTGEWTWQNGSNLIADPANTVGVYGTQGQAAATNFVGARSNASAWTDASGNFWLFGGGGYDSIGIAGPLNDLWEYSPSSGEWTWKSGCNLSGCLDGFGGLGQTAPGARSSSVTWRDRSGDIWLFGGTGVDTRGYPGFLNDLWKYTLTTGKWTLKGGTLTFGPTPGVAGVYGTLGQAAATNMPGSRFSASGWTDAGGNFWLFGGYGYDSGTTFASPSEGQLNDFWMYSPSTGEWTWKGGPNIMGAAGVHGSLGLPGASNLPGARSAAIAWSDAGGNLWLFGGSGYDSAGLIGDLNDLWWLQSNISGVCSGFGCP